MIYLCLYLCLSCGNPDTLSYSDYTQVLKSLEITKQQIQQDQIHTKLDSIIIKLKARQDEN